jgi:hypothetical protein
MTCYFRHMQGIFDDIGIEITKENKKEVDRVIHQILGVAYEDCPSAWRAIKARRADDEEAFMVELRTALVDAGLLT